MFALLGARARWYTLLPYCTNLPEKTLQGSSKGQPTPKCSPGDGAGLFSKDGVGDDTEVDVLVLQMATAM